MDMIKIPTYLQPVMQEASVREEMILNGKLSIDGKTTFRLYSSGIVKNPDGEKYLMKDPNHGPEYFVIAISGLHSEDRYIIFNGRIHGYDSMFCDLYEPNEPVLKPIELNGSSIFTGELSLYYGIDHEDEKEDYEVDPDDQVTANNREGKITWEQVKEEGFDALSMVFRNEHGEELSVELELA